MSDSNEFTLMDDTTLLSWRAQTRAELERLPPGSPGYAALTARYDESTDILRERLRES